MECILKHILPNYASRIEGRAGERLTIKFKLEIHPKTFSSPHRITPNQWRHSLIQDLFIAHRKRKHYVFIYSSLVVGCCLHFIMAKKRCFD